MRTCPACHKDFDEQEFMTKSGRTKYGQCLDCRRSYQKKVMRDRRIHDPADLRQRLVEAAGGKCARCGYSEFPSSLEFHHINASEKSSNVSNAIQRFAYGGTETQLQALMAEVGKCIMLCSNCHQGLHHGQWKLNSQMRTPINNILFMSLL